MKKFSRQLLHVGINFVLFPGPQVSNQTSLTFQQAIREAGLDISTVNFQANGIAAIRAEPSHLEISVAVNPQPPVGQLRIVSAFPKTGLPMFIKEAEAAVSAYQSAWSAPAWQIMGCDATIRDLYETEGEHAFKDLWEGRLRQPRESLQIFDKLIRGGGLRLVLDPKMEEEDPIQVEIKIESFLNDVKKIFVETVFRWLKPGNPSADISTRDRLEGMNKFIEDRVLAFIQGGSDAK